MPLRRPTDRKMVCLPACLPACLPVCLPAYLPTYLPCSMRWQRAAGSLSALPRCPSVSDTPSLIPPQDC